MFRDLASSFFLKCWKTQKPFLFVCLGSAIYTIFFAVISFLQYKSFDYSDFDFAIFVHEAWKILHGSGYISIFLDVPIWGNGLELISVINAAFFFFWKDPRVLLFLQSLALGASAIPILLIARRKVSDGLAAGIAIGYLFYPPIWFTNIYEYNPLTYTTFTLLMAFYYLQGKRFGLFMLFVFLSIINRADVGIVTFMFGLYALLEKKSWKWVVGPSMVSFLWVTIALLFVIPKFKGPLTYDSNYPQFGQGFDQVIRNMIFHPEILWQSLTTPDDANFIFQILCPVGLISLFGLKEFLICGLSLVQHLASVRYEEHTIMFHYTSTITPFVYISAIYGISNLLGKRKIVFIVCAVPILLSIITNCFYGPMDRYQYYADRFKSDAEDVYKNKILHDIPKDVPVVSTFEFSPMLAARHQYYSFHYIYKGFFIGKSPYKTPSDIQYALINFSDPRLLGFEQYDSDKKIQDFIKNGNFGIVDKINSVVFLKKNYRSEERLYDVITQSEIVSSVLVESTNGAQLKKVNSRIIKKRGHNVLSLSFYWGTQKPINEEFMMVLAIIDSQGKWVYGQQRKKVYGIYSSRNWIPGEVVVDYYDMLLPDGIKPGEYEVYVALLPLSVDPYMITNRANKDFATNNSINKIRVANFQI